MAADYDVYGLGNALVDMVYDVDGSFIQELNLDKGHMTLVDEARQNELLSKLSNKKLHRASGGSAANSMIAVAQFGGKSFYSCKVANDESGDFFMRDLQEVGVDSNLRTDNRDEGTTGKCLVLVTPDAERTMNTFLGITSLFSSKELVPDALRLAKYIYIEGYLMPAPDAQKACMQAIEAARASGVKVSMSLSDPNMVLYFKDAILKTMGSGIDLLFANEEEAKLFTGKDDIQRAAEEMRRYTKTFAITLGAKGALVCDGDRTYEVSAEPVRAIDTLGAGDMFAGAFLYAITHGADYLTAGRAATYAAGQIVAQFGPRLELPEAERVGARVQEIIREAGLHSR